MQTLIERDGGKNLCSRIAIAEDLSFTRLMQNIRWGIIGVGRFGAIHARVLASLPGSEVVAMSARRQERLAEVAGEFGVSEEKCYTDFHQLLADPDIDAVSITTHWQQHHEVALAALASGKHVLLEKPMAASVEECREVMATAKTASGFFMVGHVCRFDPRVTLAKQAIDDGRIGRIVSMHARRNLPKPGIAMMAMSAQPIPVMQRPAIV